MPAHPNRLQTLHTPQRQRNAHMDLRITLCTGAVMWQQCCTVTRGTLILARPHSTRQCCSLNLDPPTHSVLLVSDQITSKQAQPAFLVSPMHRVDKSVSGVECDGRAGGVAPHHDISCAKGLDKLPLPLVLPELLWGLRGLNHVSTRCPNASVTFLQQQRKVLPSGLATECLYMTQNCTKHQLHKHNCQPYAVEEEKLPCT